MTDFQTRNKWDKVAPNFDLMARRGSEVRWRPAKEQLFSRMGDGDILFMALGTGLDLSAFPPGKQVTAIDISPKMLEAAAPRVAAYKGVLTAELMDVHEMSFPDGRFEQVFTSCTLCSVPNPVGALRAISRVLKPGGELCMFEHTGSRYYPFRGMMNLMTLLTEKIGPAMNRRTVDNVVAAGFELLEVNNIYLDIVKTIIARKPERIRGSAGPGLSGHPAIS